MPGDARRSGHLTMDTYPSGCAIKRFWCLGRAVPKRSSEPSARSAVSKIWTLFSKLVWELISMMTIKGYF